MTRRPRIALVSRELFPFGGGGIGSYVAETAELLATDFDVTIVTASWFRDAHARLRAEGDTRVGYGGARVAFVEVPEDRELGGFDAHMHCYSHRVLERLRELYPEGGPELVEFPDYLGEGFVSTQARRGHDAFLRDTTIAVRLHTSSEMCEVLNGHLAGEYHRRLTRELERRTLRDADVLLYAGGDVLGTYRRFYGGALAPARQVRHPLGLSGRPVRDRRSSDGPLRMLYVGRLERRKGVADLVGALTTSTADWRLTLLGGDTATGPLGASVRRALELQAAGDHRIVFAPPTARAELPDRIAEHDVVVLPSRWECWPYVALEALAVGVPVIAPAVGGFVEILADDRVGLAAAEPGPLALRDTLGPLLAEPARIREAHGPATIRARLEELTDPDAIRADYRELAAGPAVLRGRAPATGEGPDPLVSVVIPYFGMHGFLEDAVRSVLAQTYPRIEVLVVNDGSFAPADVVLAEIASRYPITVLSQENTGLSGARNFGISQSRGRYVLPLDADNALDETFVARCVAVLEADEDVQYVTAWNRYADERLRPRFAGDEGYRPIGNWCPLVKERNVAGDATAVLRRRLFDHHRYSEHLTSFEDWALYRELAEAGEFGLVLPEVLWSYRVRAGSLLQTVGTGHEARLREEMDATTREGGTPWVPTNA